MMGICQVFLSTRGGNLFFGFRGINRVLHVVGSVGVSMSMRIYFRDFVIFGEVPSTCHGLSYPILSDSFERLFLYE